MSLPSSRVGISLPGSLTSTRRQRRQAAAAGNDLVALGFATGAPTLGKPTAGAVAALSALGFATGAPTIGKPTSGAVAALSALGMATGAPTLGKPTLAQEAAGGPSAWIEYDSDYVDTPERDLGTGPFTDLSASFWMKTNVPDNLVCYLIQASGDGDIRIGADGGNIRYYERRLSGDPEVLWYHDWSAPIPTDGQWHHYGVKAGHCYIDGSEVTFTDGGDGEAEGSLHPTAFGTTLVFVVTVPSDPSGKYLDLADVRLFKKASDVQAQAGYDSTLLDDGATTIVGAWLMDEGTGTAIDDRSVKASDLTRGTGMTWKP